MLKGIEGGEFIEHAEFSGNMYGTRYERMCLRLPKCLIQ